MKGPAEAAGSKHGGRSRKLKDDKLLNHKHRTERTNLRDTGL